MNGESTIESAAAERFIKEQEWNRLSAEVDQLGDRLGHPVDAGIKETIVGLWAHGLTTGQSCEGHTDHGEALPWVTVAAEQPDDWQSNPAARARWKKQNKHMASRLQLILEEWYDGRAAAGENILADARLVEDPQGIFDEIRLQPQAQARISTLGQAGRAEQSVLYLREMEQFTEYIKERFLNGDVSGQ